LIYLIGFATGIITGLALGGGAILIPFLVIFSHIEQHTAQGVTLISFLPMSVIAIVTHYRQGNIQLKLVGHLVLGSLLGATGGALLAMAFAPNVLTKIYGGFLIIMGILEIYKAEKGRYNKSV